MKYFIKLFFITATTLYSTNAVASQCPLVNYEHSNSHYILEVFDKNLEIEKKYGCYLESSNLSNSGYFKNSYICSEKIKITSSYKSPNFKNKNWMLWNRSNKRGVFLESSSKQYQVDKAYSHDCNSLHIAFSNVLNYSHKGENKLLRFIHYEKRIKNGMTSSPFE